MNLVVDLSPLLIRSAGIKGYLYYWYRALCAETKVDSFPALGPLGDLDHEHGMAPAWRLAQVHFARLTRGLSLPTCDVFHATNMMLGGPRRAKLTTTLHDITSWKTPEHHTEANRRLDASFAERILRRADGIIAVSENTRRDAIEVLHVDPDKIRTIHSGVAEAFFAASNQDAAAMAEKYRLRKPYVLFVGTLEPRKNIDRLLDAWQSLQEADAELVIAGPTGWASAGTLERLNNGVRRLGYVPERDLPGLTKGAALLAYPSLYEGFGFPVAQAMACGVPVLTSNVSSLPEVAGGGALLVDPMSVDDIRCGLRSLLDSPGLRETLGAAGRRRAECYRWSRCARESLQFFSEVAGATTRKSHA